MSNSKYTITEFEILLKEFKSLKEGWQPEFGNVDHIYIIKHLARTNAYERLMGKHKGDKGEGVYRTKLYDKLKVLVGIMRHNIKK